MTFREDCCQVGDLNIDLENVLSEIEDQTHAALTLGKNDEMDIEDTQILKDFELSQPKLPPHGETMKPWPKDKIGGGRKRKMGNPLRPSQSQYHVEGSSHQKQENVRGGEEMGGENVGRGEDVGEENVRGGEDVGSSRGSHTRYEEEPLLTITLGEDSQVLNLIPLETIRPEPEEPIIRKSDRSRNVPKNYTPPTIPKRGKK
ncbi:OLC1v1030588C1 [Oldenlandia corymbosa var. corymbosa]|uniref:OLC1v1030588C1 n=1 Tax=Oldenlandia corymbosa var. corymbosa TaxID=529605 RepID=A0AAV1CIA0_OLDCO|nr:OLC1v1030588C1 [Oldenlandia corymbosa var. corymbosa]